ncbi:MAG: hypothetical protein HYU81_02465 [Candidatus Brennerbacteria bacterium]|nr:hypothetical protein [Candidatus Brennerbacteria bacterium]
MRKIKLINLSGLGEHGVSDAFPPFTVDGYEFHSQVPANRRTITTYTPVMAVRDNRVHRQNAYVLFNHAQEDSVLYKGGMIGTAAHPTQKRKFLEDILVLGSLLTKYNWAFYSRRHTPGYPIAATSHLRTITTDYIELQRDLPPLISKLKDTTWQQQFNNGFHLTMLLNSANNYNTESRFLSRVIIWEFLYEKIFGRESENLQEIIKTILEHFWNNQVNNSIFLTHRVGGLSKNIFYVLRNQLAHSGKLPINRSYAEQWMTQIPWEGQFGTMTRGIVDYLRFFDELTQVIVMKTMNFHPETKHIFNAFNFTENLNRFLSTGKI